MTARFTIAENDGTHVVTAYVDGQLLTTDKATNPNYDRITEMLFEDNTAGIADLFTAEVAVERKFKNVSERVSVSGGKVFFDGDAIDDTLSDHLLRLIHEGQDVTPLVLFWENIANNPSQHSRESLFRWLQAEDFTITPQGLILGYKGLRDNFTSIHAGPATVDGVGMSGNIPNKEGSVIEIARSTVVADSFAACAYGLHVGTDSYARSFGAVTVEALVNPRDVVSVPTDCNGSKMRVCRYKVGKVSEVKQESSVIDYDDDWQYDYSDEWEDISYY